MYWEPNNTKLAIHTLSKRILEAGRKDYSVNAKRNGVDIYEMIDDPLKGFIYKTIGFLNCDKVDGMSWAGCGDIFTITEKEGMRLSIQFYLIVKDLSA